MNTDLKWHLIFTKAGTEKRVAHLLEQRGLEIYLPTLITSLVAGNQATLSSKPLFSSWVFVHCSIDELPRLRSVKGVVNLVYRWSKPVVVSQAEVNTLRFVLGNFSRIALIHTGLQPSEKPLPEKRLAYPLPSLGYCLVADERAIAKSSDPSIRTIPNAYANRLALVKESFVQLLSHFPSLVAPKR